jgi:hypothetical protein
MEKIREAQSLSRTADEFMLSLKEIIKEIQATVPEIQQRNLLKATVALYYITKEIDLLLKEGLMPVDLKQLQHIRLRSENETENIWAGACVIASDIGPAILSALESMAAAAGSTLHGISPGNIPDNGTSLFFYRTAVKKKYFIKKQNLNRI